MFATLMTRPRLLAAVTIAVLALLTCHPTLAKSVGADVWNAPALGEQLREETGLNDRLDAQDDAVLRRLALKEALVGELLAGRATLAEVTAKFVELNATRPACMAAIRACFPGLTDREMMARNVISYAVPRAPNKAQRALSQRLEAELQQMIAERRAP